MELNAKSQRPTIRMKEFHGLYALLDTGAVFPVWVASEKWLEELGAAKIMDNVSFGGFGGMATGNLFRLPLLRIGELYYPNMCIIAHRFTMVTPLVLPATMFSHLIYEIDDYHHRLNISIPDTESNVRNLVIKDTEGHLHVACTSAE